LLGRGLHLPTTLLPLPVPAVILFPLVIVPAHPYIQFNSLPTTTLPLDGPTFWVYRTTFHHLVICVTRCRSFAVQLLPSIFVVDLVVGSHPPFTFYPPPGTTLLLPLPRFVVYPYGWLFLLLRTPLTLRSCYNLFVVTVMRPVAAPMLVIPVVPLIYYRWNYICGYLLPYPHCFTDAARCLAPLYGVSSSRTQFTACPA